MHSEVFIYLASRYILPHSRLQNGKGPEVVIWVLQRSASPGAGRGNRAEGCFSVLGMPSLINVLTKAPLAWSELLS